MLLKISKCSLRTESFLGQRKPYLLEAAAVCLHKNLKNAATFVKSVHCVFVCLMSGMSAQLAGCWNHL